MVFETTKNELNVFVKSELYRAASYNVKTSQMLAGFGRSEIIKREEKFYEIS